MLRRSLRRYASYLAFLLVLLSSGCSPQFAEVEGGVQYNGRPVEKGMVTFTPTSGVGSVVGGNIENGRFTAKGVSAGQNIVVVVATRSIAFPQDSQSLATSGPPTDPKGNKDTNWKIPADWIPPNAEGNNTTYDLVPGSNTIDLHLSSPKSP